MAYWVRDSLPLLGEGLFALLPAPSYLPAVGLLLVSGVDPIFSIVPLPSFDQALLIRLVPMTGYASSRHKEI